MKQKCVLAVTILLVITIFSACSEHSSTTVSPVPTDDSGTILLATVDKMSQNHTQYIAEHIALWPDFLNLMNAVPFGEGMLINGDDLVNGETIHSWLRLIDREGNLLFDFEQILDLSSETISKMAPGDDGAYLILESGTKQKPINRLCYVDASCQLHDCFLVPLRDGFSLSKMVVCSDGILIIWQEMPTDNHPANRSYLEVYSPSGSLLVEHELPLISSAVCFGDKVYISQAKTYTTVNNSGKTIYGSSAAYQFDVESGQMMELCTVDSGRLFSCDAENLYFTDAASLFRYELHSGLTYYVLDWADTGALPPRIMFPLNESKRFVIYDARTGLATLSQNDMEAAEETRKEIVLAAMSSLTPYTSQVLRFNESNSDYRIVIRDYSQYPNGEDILRTEIISGNSPDLIDIRAFSGDLIREDLLEDLLPYINSDPEIDLSDFFPSVLNVMEQDGKFLSAIPFFSIKTLLCRDVFYPEGINTIDTFAHSLSEDGGSFHDLCSREELMALAFCSNTTLSYSTEEIATILAISKELANEEHISSSAHEIQINAGLQHLILSSVGGAPSIRMYELALNGKMKALGLPFSDKNTGLIIPRVELGILSSSDVKEGAWQFIRLLFDKDFQSGFGGNDYPILMSAYQRTIDEDTNTIASLCEKYGAVDFWFMFGDQEIDVPIYEPLGWDCATYILSKPYGVYRYNDTVLSLVMKCAEEYYGGKWTAQEAANNIRTKLETYVAERS